MSPEAPPLLLLISSLRLASAIPSQTHWKGNGDVAVNNKWVDYNEVVPLAVSPGYDLDSEVKMTLKPLIHSSHRCVPCAATDPDWCCWVR
ncbi:hypothetical protein CORC01_06392 [Colletotrichum orchidophilum]|uniref:Uncharacterized protein n=1 Tax=Colletotrichum orchidophilum TaxID=1209926 RepID=A0A1G4BAQ7_9PEZI|nr:uncharacterized protein CORC01_06392 [Colletotrichum orchidophilum]OHE98396.1 hypothetical protein CORC01_06392 [Colletotrichum orchidophilum]